MAYVRVKPWERGAAVAHPLTEQFVCPDPGILYEDSDPLVQAHPWLFATDDEIAEKTAAKRTITEVVIPTAPEVVGEPEVEEEPAREKPARKRG